MKIKITICLALLLSLCASCAAKPKSLEKEIFAMDTLMNLTVCGEKAEGALKAAESEINALDTRLDVNDAESEVSKLNASAGSFTPTSEAVRRQLETANEVAEKSGGAFDISILPLMELWGFGTDGAHVPADAEIAAVLNAKSAEKIKISGENVLIPSGERITLAATAKGYTSQRVTELWRDMGVESAIMSLGGNVQALGKKPDGSKWNVAVRDPENPESFLGTLEIENTAVVTSGGYQRYFEENGVRYHHIIDPKTGRPAKSGLTSVTIVCPDGTLADALSTALFVLGEDGALKYWRSEGGFEFLLVTEDGRVVATAGLRDSFRLVGDYALSFAEK